MPEQQGLQRAQRAVDPAGRAGETRAAAEQHDAAQRDEDTASSRCPARRESAARRTRGSGGRRGSARPARRASRRAAPCPVPSSAHTAAPSSAPSGSAARQRQCFSQTSAAATPTAAIAVAVTRVPFACAAKISAGARISVHITSCSASSASTREYSQSALRCTKPSALSSPRPARRSASESASTPSRERWNSSVNSSATMLVTLPGRRDRSAQYISNTSARSAGASTACTDTGVGSAAWCRRAPCALASR